MGVQTYLLDRRKTKICIGDAAHRIGTLRRFWKITELNLERSAEVDAARALIRGKAAPLAVMVADASEFSLVDDPCKLIPAHLVIGWDADRSMVTDFCWDHLPVLGYGVRNEHGSFVLHEERNEVLSPMDVGRAAELGIINQAGKLIRRGQPTIEACLSVQPYIRGYADAACVLTKGITAEVLTEINSDDLPTLSWYVGKRPSDVKVFLA